MPPVQLTGTEPRAVLRSDTDAIFANTLSVDASKAFQQVSSEGLVRLAAIRNAWQDQAPSGRGRHTTKKSSRSALIDRSS
jgi:hypothetical protein